MKMNRIAYLFTRRFYKVPWLFHEIGKAGNENKYTIEERYNIVRNVCKKVNRYAHVEIECSGLENIPNENGYILTPNHQGLFDVLLICDTHKNPTSFVIRNDLANVPLLKQTIKALDAKAIDRDDPRQGMQIIKEMTEGIKQEYVCDKVGLDFDRILDMRLDGYRLSYIFDEGRGMSR